MLFARNSVCLLIAGLITVNYPIKCLAQYLTTVNKGNCYILEDEESKHDKISVLAARHDSLLFWVRETCQNAYKIDDKSKTVKTYMTY